MSGFPKTVAASLAETSTKFTLCEALATEIPLRGRCDGGSAVQSGLADGVMELLEAARQAIIAAGGEAKSVNTLKCYRLTALWVLREDGTFAWVPGLSFSAHDAARQAAGLSFEQWSSNPTREDLKRGAEQRAASAELVEAKEALVEAEVKRVADMEAVAITVRAEMEAKAAEQRARLQAEAEESRARALAEQDAAAVAKARHAAEQHARQARAAALRDLAAEGKEAGRSAAEGTITERHLVTTGCPDSAPPAHLVSGFDAEETGAFADGYSKGFVEIWNAKAREHQRRENDKIVAQRKLQEAKEAQERAEAAKAAAEARAAAQLDYSITSSVACIVENASKVTPEQWAQIAAAQLSVLADA